METKQVKPRVKKGLWKPEEDLILKTYVETHGEGNWTAVSAKSGLMRGGKSCRLRWMNYLRPNIKRGGMSEEEEDLIIRMHKLLGNRWSLIAGRLPGRTDNEVKNYWNTHMNKSSSTKRKSMDSSNNFQNENKKLRRRRKNNQPICQKTTMEESEEKKEERISSVCDNTWIQEAQRMNYYIESPILVPANSTDDTAFVFGYDEPYVGYFDDAFVLFESFTT